MSSGEILYCSASITETNLREALKARNGEHGMSVLKNPKLFKSMFDALKSVATGNFTKGGAEAFSIASIGAISATASGVKSVNNSELANGVSFATSMTKSTVDLTKVVRLTSVSGQLAMIGSVGVQKSGIMISFLGGQHDSDQAKCLGAILEFSGSAAVTVIAGAGTGGLAITLTGLSLIASAVNVGMQCNSVLTSK